MDAYRMIDKLVGALDGLTMARGMLPESGDVSEGMDHIFDLVSNALDCGGVTIICPARGDAFDPMIHQCVRVDGDRGDGYAVSEVVSVGYYIDGKMIRPASVCVYARQPRS